MDKDPAFLFYSKDWLTGTADMMPDEKGVYIDLLCYQHQKGGLPTDTTRLAKMIGISHTDFLRIWETVSTKFHQMDNQLVNRRLTIAINERAIRAKKNRISGTFASVLKRLREQYSGEKITALRHKFKVDDYLEFPDETIETEITNWCTKWCTN